MRKRGALLEKEGKVYQMPVKHKAASKISSCQHSAHLPSSVTLFCCTVFLSWKQCWTKAGENAAGTGPVDITSEGWSRDSGWPGRNQCVEYSQ